MKWLPKIISMIFLWGVVGVIIIFIDPQLLRNIWLDDLYAPLLLAILIATWYTMSLVISSSSIGFVNALLLVLGLVLQLLHILNVLSLAGILGTILFLSYFAIKRSGKDILLHQPKVDNLNSR